MDQGPGRITCLWADVILPGHGPLCGEAEIDLLAAYLRQTWELTEELVGQGLSLKAALKDDRYPRPEGWDREQLFEKNIELMYKQISD